MVPPSYIDDSGHHSGWYGMVWWYLPPPHYGIDVITYKSPNSSERLRPRAQRSNCWYYKRIGIVSWTWQLGSAVELEADLVLLIPVTL
jgi:hypothetical protein